MTNGVTGLFNPMNWVQFYTQGRGVWTSNRVGALGVMHTEVAKLKKQKRPGKMRTTEEKQVQM